ncbi:hypothetical protein ACLTEW_24470 [Gordonia lacunae]|uniref:hypothetical protein n=1 Tax=Gordonia TaxID=2053 RepID=UPI00200B737B|nr:hypothetical protein [Gordonia terrae]UPW12023.1 hypothetical protein M1C59_25570 [Gordonia terrae]
MSRYIEDFAQEFRDSASHWRKDWDGQWQGVDGAAGAPPDHWATAIRLVSQDLGSGLLANIVDLTGASWHVFISPDGQAKIELHIIRDGEETGFVSNDELTSANCTVEDAIYRTAAIVQGDLTGYHHILWPEIGGRLFEPTKQDGKTYWADLAGRDARVFEIGQLAAAT